MFPERKDFNDAVNTFYSIITKPAVVLYHNL